jgi:hypothetical protein|tara:strand:+ start:671 stop:1009 length:339 start_codon:yes stop_codon:yes gene_type:complete
MHIDDYVRANKEVIKFVQNAVPGAIDKYVGTLDYATARFNTTLLKISQEPLMLDEHMPEARDCFNAIQSFYKNTQRLIAWPWMFKPIAKIILHVIGTRQIPKIKRLLDKVNN